MQKFTQFTKKDEIAPAYINTKNPKSIEIDGTYYSGIIIVNYKIPKVEILQEKTIKYIKNYNKSKLYNEYDIGGYLIYKDIKPFIDSRADLYVSTIFSDNCNMELNNPKIIEKYNFDLFLVSKNSNIYNYLSKRKSIYKTVINDKDYVLIKK